MGRGRGLEARTETRANVVQFAGGDPLLPGSDPRRTTLAILARNPRPYCTLDIETTGLDGASDRIWEIGIVFYDAQGREEGRYSAVINPECQVKQELLDMCDVTQEELDRGRPAAEVLAEVARLVEDRVVATYNADFDVGFLDHEGRRLGFTRPIVNAFFCALTATRWYLPGQRSYKLGEVCSRLRVPLDYAHRALADALATGGVLREIMPRAARPDVDPVAEYISGRIQSRVYEWRKAVGAALGVPVYLILNSRETADIANTCARYWRQPGFSVRRVLGSVLARQVVAEVAPDPEQPGGFVIRRVAGAAPLRVRLAPPECSSCGAPKEGEFPCGHVFGTARRLVLDHHLLSLEDAVIAPAPAGAGPKALVA